MNTTASSPRDHVGPSAGGRCTEIDSTLRHRRFAHLRIVAGAFALAVGALAVAAPADAAPLVIDHTAVEQCGQIPDAYVAAVKSMWLSIPGESHSLGYRKGLTLLAGLEPRLAARAQESGTPTGRTNAFLRVSRASWGDVGHSAGWRYGYGEEDWYTSSTAVARTKAFLQYAASQNLGLAAVGFGWCWDATWHNTPGGSIDPVYQVRWAGASVGGPQGDKRWGLDADDAALTGNSVCLDTYLAATQAYVDYSKANGLGTLVFFTTGAIDGYAGESAYQRHLKYERIREYVRRSSDNVLFDYADILAWNNSGQKYTRTWTDHAGRVQTYPLIHPDNMRDLNGGYVEDGDHIGEVGAIRLAKAVWVLLARKAGWQPDGMDTVPPTSPAPVVGTVVSSTSVRLSWSAATDASGPVSYEVYRNGTLIADTAQTSYLDSGLSSGQTYDYTVWALDPFENGTQATTTVSLSATPSYVLTVGGAGGTVVRSPDRASYPAGTTVSLTAVGDEGYQFVRWEGGLAGTANPASIQIQADTSVTAVFARDSSPGDPGLTGLWHFDEGSGLLASDTSGGGNQGQLRNGTRWTPGVEGSAALFDGVNDSVDLTSDAFGITNAFTVALWVRGTALGGSWMVMAQRGEYISPFGVRFDGHSRVQFRVRAGSSVASVLSRTALSAGSWHHVAVTYANGTAIIYLDGREDGRATVSGALVVNPGETTSLGAAPSASYPLNGAIDEVHLYNRALAPAEILELAGGGP